MAKKVFVGLAKDFINNMKTHFIGQGARPEDIFVQDMFSYEPKNQTRGLLKNLTSREHKMLDLTPEKRAITETLLSVYNQHIDSKREILTQARTLFDTDIVQTVIDVMIDDGFNSFNNENEEFRIEYLLEEDELKELGEEYQQQIQNIIDEFVEKFAIKSKIADIVPELLRDGEYALGVLFDEKTEKGITEIVDDMGVIDLIPFYHGEELAFVIKDQTFDENGGDKRKWKSAKDVAKKPPMIYKPENVVFFRLKGPTKKRINMSAFYDNEFRQLFFKETNIRLPKFIRTSLPIYASAMKALKRLQIMENVSTVLDLSEVLKPEIVTVTVPAATSPTEAQVVANDYERHLNDITGLDDAESLDFSTLVTTANRRKVIPQWLDQKGIVASAGLSEGGKSESAWHSIDKLRNLIALSIGIPPFYINISETPADKAQIIKLYSRYTRKLTSLQKTLADGTKDLILLHLSKMGINVKRDNISVKFKAITSGDALDDTDMMVATVTGINDLYKGIEEITNSDNNNLVLDDEQFKQLFNNLTSRYLNISNLIKIDENKFEDVDAGFEDDGFEPLGSPSRDRGAKPSAPSGDDGMFSDLTPDQEDKLDSANDNAYDDFANWSDNVELSEPQSIETEV